MTTALPEEPRDDESLADALNRLNQRADDSFANEAASDAWFEKLYAFRRAHSSRFALRGANVPEVIVGINRGNGEVSRCDGERWSYRLDFDKLKTDFIDGIADLTESPETAPRSPEVSQRLATVHSKLRACSSGA